jgi:hypothetical protein
MNNSFFLLLCITLQLLSTFGKPPVAEALSKMYLPSAPAISYHPLNVNKDILARMPAEPKLREDRAQAQYILETRAVKPSSFDNDLSDNYGDSSEEEECANGYWFHIRGRRCVPNRCIGGIKFRNRDTGDCIIRQDYIKFAALDHNARGFRRFVP